MKPASETSLVNISGRRDQPMSKLSLSANAAHSGPASVLAFKSMRNTHRVTKQVRHPVLSAGRASPSVAGPPAVTPWDGRDSEARPPAVQQREVYARPGCAHAPAPAPTSLGMD